MDLYLVKELVQMTNLEEFRARNGPGRKPSLCFDLKFPDLLKPVDQSKSVRYFAGKVRELVNRDYECAEAHFELNFEYDGYKKKEFLMSYIYLNICREMYDENIGFDNIFGEENFKFSMTLSLCHLPNETTPVSPEALFTLNKRMDWSEDYGYKGYGFESYDKGNLKELKKLWNHETGFIYSKITIVVTLNEDAVKMVMEQKGRSMKEHEIAATTRKMLTDEICTDLEIRCMDGIVVRCHRAVLGGRSKVFQAMFQAEGMEEARTGRLEMEEMSEKGVRAFLGWIYWNDEEEALLDPDVAVKLLIAGDKYDLGGLVDNMKEIILERRGYDEEWFTVESAMNLLGWAKHLEGMKELRDKADEVLKLKTFPEKLVGLEEHKELIKNDAEAAMED